MYHLTNKASQLNVEWRQSVTKQIKLLQFQSKSEGVVFFSLFQLILSCKLLNLFVAQMKHMKSQAKVVRRLLKGDRSLPFLAPVLN